MPQQSANAFGAESVEEIYLPKAPLAMALAQVRFPRVPELLDDDHLSKLHNRLKKDYPIMREDSTVGFLLSFGGNVEGPPAERIVRFNDKTETWQFSIGQNFMAINTSEYSNRHDFRAKFERAIEAITDIASPIIFDRVGIRYVNRFSGEDLNHLNDLITAPFLGLLPVDLSPARITQNFTQAVLQLEQANIGARWGLLPPGAIIDPALTPVNSPSWILDVDAFQERKGDFEATEIGRHIGVYADIAYRFFRLAVTDDLIRRAGGLT